MFLERFFNTIFFVWKNRHQKKNDQKKKKKEITRQLKK